MADNDPWLNGNKTWQKWKGLGAGGGIKYDRNIWAKPKDEERLIRSLQVKKRNNDKRLEDKRRAAEKKGVN
jgi:hypothetical protein